MGAIRLEFAQPFSPIIEREVLYDRPAYQSF